MRSLRLPLIALATVFTMKVAAQMPYTWIINGTVPGCYAGQVVTIQSLPGTTPPFTITVPVDTAICAFSATIGISSTTAAIAVSTPCMGAIISESDSAIFNFIADTAWSNLLLNCGGACQASFTVDQSAPWTMTTTNTSTGNPPLAFSWWMPDGSGSTAFEPSFTFSGPGLYGICLTMTDASACTSSLCDTVMVDSTGAIFTGTFYYDCLGVLLGPNVPGSPCDDGDSTTIFDTWSTTCVCLGDSNSFFVDCMGVFGGPDMPGTSCDDGDSTTVNDTWTAACDCVGGTAVPCQADFWVVQAYTYDSLLGTATPIPYELWLWNLSSGGSGTYTFFWSFGDGTGSSLPFPSHTYSGSGPYMLCLTIDDGMGCTSTYCDTVAVDSDGIYTGFTGGGGERATGFTINVLDPGATGLAEVPALDGLHLWPNPAEDVLNLTVNSSLSGAVEIAIHDMSGRIVLIENRRMISGRNNTGLRLEGIDAGMYVVRIGRGANVVATRFVKR